MYAIYANAVIGPREDGYSTARSVPTFYLDENVQGIVSEDHAAAIAKDILTATGQTDVQLHILAVKV